MWNRKIKQEEKEREAFEQTEMSRMLKEMVDHHERIPLIFGKSYLSTCEIYQEAKQRWNLEKWKQNFLHELSKKLDKCVYDEVEEILNDRIDFEWAQNYMDSVRKKLGIYTKEEKDVDYVGKPLTWIPMTATKEAYEKTMEEVYASQLKGQIERYEKLTGKHMSVKEVDEPNLPSYCAEPTEPKSKELNRMMWDMIEHGITIPLAFAVNDYPTAVRSYRKAKQKWEKLELDKQEHAEPVEEEPSEKSSYYIGIVDPRLFHPNLPDENLDWVPVTASELRDEVKHRLSYTMGLEESMYKICSVSREVYDSFMKEFFIAPIKREMDRFHRK